MGRRKSALLGVLVFWAICNLGCATCEEHQVRGSGPVVARTVDVSGVRAVALKTFGTLHIEMGDREELRIETQRNLQEYFEVEVSRGTLSIGSRRSVSIHPTEPVRFYLTVKTLETISLSGSGDVRAPDLEAEDFSLKVTGSGDVSIGGLKADGVYVRISGSGDTGISTLETGECEVSVSGSGDVTVDRLDAARVGVTITGSGDVEVSGGETEVQRITISGSGDYEARRLESAEAEVVVNGSGSADLHVRDVLAVKIRGSGDVRYRGRPSVRSTVTGSGDVIGP